MWLILFGGFSFGKIWKNSRFSGWLRPEWGSTAQVATAGLGSIGLRIGDVHLNSSLKKVGPVPARWLAVPRQVNNM